VLPLAAVGRARQAEGRCEDSNTREMAGFIWAIAREVQLPVAG
jgi:hypothetical protein